jgi:DNA-binding NtrC family response regulator
MPKPNLLWLVTGSQQVVESSWIDALTDFHIIPAATLAQAQAAIVREGVDCALLSGLEGDVDLADALEVLNQADPTLPVVVWYPEMRATEAVRLIRAGAFHCVGYKDTTDTLRDSVANAAEEKRRRQKAHDHSAAPETWRRLLVGDSSAMERVVETIRLVGTRRCTVLITGETGTGKEMVARAIHEASPRAAQTMVALNCSALPEHLLEAELFGHVKGAFTGAINARVGRFEQANRSTLFLDEIADMPLELQAKLLRVLQDREIQRLGSSETIKVDVRVIAATNVNLLDRVRQGKFREDLYYRLNVVPVTVPPLRERDSDIPQLVEHFVKKVCQLEDIPLKTVAPEIVGRLRTCQWPGNVRQLENTVEMAVTMSGNREVLYASDFGLTGPVPVRAIPAARETCLDELEYLDFEAAVTQFERSMLERALTKTAGNKTAAAEMLGLKRTTLIMKLRSLQTNGISLVS